MVALIEAALATDMAEVVAVQDKAASSSQLRVVSQCLEKGSLTVSRILG